MIKKYGFNEVMIVPQTSQLGSRSQVDVNVYYFTKHSSKVISGCPVIVSNMDTTGQIGVACSLFKHNMFVALHKYYSPQELISFMCSGYSKYSFITIGFDESYMETLDAINKYAKITKIDSSQEVYEYPMINIDVANGYMTSFLDYIKKVRDKCPESIIMAGNVCTPEGVENIINAGADIAKCGIANGGFCLTANKSGIGYPQFSVAQECGQAARELGALCCSDGGCKTPADICKALAAGSHFVMVGSMFAGHDENQGNWEFDKLGNRVRMQVYGMSSKVANDKYNGGLQSYRTSEGREGFVNYKGPIENTVQDIKGGLASCCTYTNTRFLKFLHENASFIGV